jgi:FdrA protein
MARVTSDFVELRRGAFFDSVTLMLASRDALEQPGVRAASALAATPLNLGLLAEQGFELDAADGARPDDLVVAVRADDRTALEAALAALERRLAEPAAAAGERRAEPARTLRGALRRTPGLSVALVSVPGAHAAVECAAALEAGLHVFCFSDGMAVADERALKRMALERDLLLMGPECGTAIVDGVGLGFANVVERGPVGIVGASGTGIQALCCLLDAAGVGVSHAIGVGGRDLLPELGGSMTRRAAELLAGDPGTRAIALVGKRGAVAPALEDAARGKPLVVAIPGESDGAASLEDAAARLCELVGATPASFRETLRGGPRPGTILGLYSGGTLCDEAATVVAAGAGADRVEVAAGQLAPPGERHLFIDFGAEPLTSGRPHPMIDPTLRADYLAREAAAESVSALLLDVVLGRGAHPDPAAPLTEALAAVQSRRRAPLAVIAAVCGSERDPQGLAAQSARLEAAGAVVTRSGAHAARLALAAVGTG